MDFLLPQAKAQMKDELFTHHRRDRAGVTREA
jgi:hypothetical protein